MQNLSSKVLVVDDEPGMCRLLETVLLGEGYEVSAFQKSSLALDLLRKDAFDLVITDIRMPKVNGLQILEAVKSTSPGTPVILITAFSTVESAIQAVKLGAADYIVKPFRNDQIKLAVYRVFERERLLNENKLLRRKLADPKQPATQTDSAESELSSYREAKQRVVSDFERDYLTRLLLKVGGNVSKAAAWADMDRKNFYDLLRKHHLHAVSEPLAKDSLTTPKP